MKHLKYLLGILLIFLPVFTEAEHPMDALTASEINATTAALRKEGHLDDKTLVASITLLEPPKTEVLAWRAGDSFARKVKAILRHNAKTFEAVVDLRNEKD